MALSIFSKDLGEFTYKCAAKESHDVFISHISVILRPLLRSAKVIYQVAERKENGTLSHSTPLEFLLVWAHATNLFRLNEAFEFMSERALSLPTVVAGNFIERIAADETIVTWSEVDTWDNTKQVNLTPPATRLSMSNIQINLSSLETENSFDLEWITCKFGSTAIYEISWDLFLEFIFAPKPRLILGIDMSFDEELKRLDIMPISVPSAQPVVEETPVNDTEVAASEEEAPEANEEVVVSDEESLAEGAPVTSGENTDSPKAD